MKNSNLQSIPGVGPSIEKDLISIGINSVKDLKGKNPELLYRRLSEINKKHLDRCVLYVFRCAVYFAENPNPEPKLIKWWNWKDGKKAIKNHIRDSDFTDELEMASIRANENLIDRLKKVSRDARRKKGTMSGSPAKIK